MESTMNSAPQDQIQQEPPTSAGPHEALLEQPPSLKREYDDDVQFISSHPIKKMRLTGDEQTVGGEATVNPASSSSGDQSGDGSQTTEKLAPGPDDGGQSQTDNHVQVNNPAQTESNIQTGNDTSVPDRCVSAMPLGLPSHLSAGLTLEHRGASLPAMENFSFPSPHAPASARPPPSAAVSPRQLPQTTPSGVMPGSQFQTGHGLTSNDITIDQVLCLDVREPPLPSFTNLNNIRDMHNVSNSNSMSNMGMNGINHMANTATLVTPSVTGFMTSNSSSTGGSAPYPSYPQSGHILQNPAAPMPFAMYSMGNLVALPQMQSSYNSSDMGMTGNQGTSNSQASYNQNPGPTAGVSSSSAPSWQPTGVGAHYTSPQYPYPPRLPQMPMASMNTEYPGNPSQPVVPQKRPCLACAAVRKQGCHAQSHGPPGGLRPEGNPPSHAHLPSSRHGASSLQNQVYPTVQGVTNVNDHQRNIRRRTRTDHLAWPAYLNPQTLQTSLGASNRVHAETLHQPGHRSCTMGATATVSAHNHPGTGTNYKFRQNSNSLTPIPNSILTPTNNFNVTPANNFPFPAPSSTIRQPVPVMLPSLSISRSSMPQPPHAQPQVHPLQQQQQTHPAHPKTQPQVKSQSQPQPPPPTLPPQPTPISAAATAAATHASTRTRHAANLLVDVAELVTEIFPFDIVARQHGAQPRKVAEALAAVLQVPLLRCTTDRRRAGKLGSERMKDFRDARKVWVGMVREWEKEKEKERGEEADAEGETDEEMGVVGKGIGESGKLGSGEPSPLDVALLLEGSEMPGLLREHNFFTGPW